MTIFYTADLHLRHRRSPFYDKQGWDTAMLGEYPFTSSEERDNAIIERWNSVVGGNDTVYILGDFCYAKRDEAIQLLACLHGKKHIVRGNHDRAWLGECVGIKGLNLRSVSDTAIVSDHSQKLVLFHYPMFAWADQHKGSFHIYGHVHATKEEELYRKAGKLLAENDIPEFRAMNAGTMLWDYMPVTFEQMRFVYGFGLGRFD